MVAKPAKEQRTHRMGATLAGRMSKDIWIAKAVTPAVGFLLSNLLRKL